MDEERSVPIDDEAESRLTSRIAELQREFDSLPRETRVVSVTSTEYVCPESLLAKPVETTTDDGVPF